MNREKSDRNAAVLIVDGNRDDARKLTDTLKGDFGVILAKDVKEAESLLQKRSYPLIIADMETVREYSEPF